MGYILIIFMSFGVVDGGATSQQIKFNNLASCEAAKTQIIREFKNPAVGENSWGRRAIIAVCSGA